MPRKKIKPEKGAINIKIAYAFIVVVSLILLFLTGPTLPPDSPQGLATAVPDASDQSWDDFYEYYSNITKQSDESSENVSFSETPETGDTTSNETSNLTPPTEAFTPLKDPTADSYLAKATCTTTLTVTSATPHTVSGTESYDCIYVQNGATLTINGNLTANEEMIIYGGGIVTHGPNLASKTNWTSLTVLGNLTLAAGGIINLDSKGYTGGIGGVDGSGPGAGKFGTADLLYAGSGAGYGGQGSDARHSTGGTEYGALDLDKPSEPGSGGGGAGAEPWPAYGGSGGGLAIINVGDTAIIDGDIRANGGNGSARSVTFIGVFYSGGGSGGAIFLNATNLEGSGSISADGGTSGSRNGNYVGGGGAGGRIAIHYNTSSFTGSLSAVGGRGDYSIYGGAGSIFTKKWNHDFGNLELNNLGRVSKARSLYFNGTFESFTRNENSNLLIPSTTVFTITNSTSFTSLKSVINQGTLNFSEVLAITFGALLQNEGTIIAPLAEEFNLGGEFQNTGNVTLDALRTLKIYQYTNNTGKLYASSLEDLFVSGTMVYAPSAYIFPQGYSLTINDTGILTHHNNSDVQRNYIAINLTNLTIHAGGRIDLDSKGYMGGQDADGFGPGGGKFGFEGSLYTGGGAGYGGQGSDASKSDGGPGYGFDSITMPTELGSGGGGANMAWGVLGGAGGGRLHLSVSDTAIINGEITADGGNGSSRTVSLVGVFISGAGSGGGIFINASNIQGSGTISSKGGDGGERSGTYEGGGGAGGRIAIHYNTSTFTGALSAKGGRGDLNIYGGAGSIYVERNAKSYLLFDNSNNLATGSLINMSELPSDVVNLTIRNGANALFSDAHNILNVTGTLTINDSEISVSDPNNRIHIASPNFIEDDVTYPPSFKLTYQPFGNGWVAFKGGVVGLSNLTRNIVFDDNYIFVNTTSVSGLNLSANVSLINVTIENPAVFYDSDGDGSFESWCSGCEVYDYDGYRILFNVSRFSSYTIKEQTHLQVWDDTDYLQKYVGQQNYFYANFTNLSSGDPIVGAGAYCEFSENSSGSFSSPDLMTYNATAELYQYNRSFLLFGNFTFNITCNGTSLGFTVVDAKDNFSVGARAPQINFTLPTPPNGANLDLDSIRVNVSTNDPLNHSAFIDWDDSLLAWLSFDSYNASGIYDNSSYVSFASFNGGINTDNITTGHYGKALSFDGVNDYLSIPEHMRWDSSDAITVESWVRLDGPCVQDAIAVRDISSYKWLLYCTTSGPNPNWVQFYVRTGSGAKWLPTTPNNIYDGKWHHVAGTYDRALPSKRMKFYLDGLLIEELDAADEAILDGDQGVTVGSHYDVLANGFEGGIDELRIWGRALSYAEINASYNAGLHMLERNFTNLTPGRHSVRAHAINLAGQVNSTELRNITLNKAPEITFTEPPTPQDNANTTDENVTFNVSITEQNLKQVIKNWNGTNATVYNSSDDSLVLMLNFNNLSALGENNTFVRDLSRYGNNATCFGASCPQFTEGKYYGGHYFDGSMYFDAGNDSSLDVRGPITIEAWVKRGSEGHGQIVAKPHTNGYSSYLLTVYPYGAIYAEDSTGASPWETVIQYYHAYNDEQWHHYVATSDTSIAKLYVDGELVGNDTSPAATKVSLISPVTIGWYGLAGAYSNRYLTGNIDEVRIYNRTLSSDEVKAHYYSNVMKYDNDKWSMMSEQHVDEPPVTSDIRYDYRACAVDLANNINCTETRNIQIRGVAPKISFGDLAHENDSDVIENYVALDFSLNESNLNELKFEWGGTNQTIYNDSLVLMLNLDNLTALGEKTQFIRDLSSYGNNGLTYSSSLVSFEPDGRYNGAFNFSGLDQSTYKSYISVPYDESLSLQEMTLSAWVNLSAKEAPNHVSQSIIDRVQGGLGVNSPPNYRLFVNGLGQVIYTADLLGGGDAFELISNETIPLDGSRWHYLTATTNGTHARIYIDGELKNETPYFGPLKDGAYYGTERLYAGVHVGGRAAMTNAARGMIDEVRIWNRPLTANQVMQQYSSNLRKYDTDKWALFVNESVTREIDTKSYSYRACAIDFAGNENCTDKRDINILGYCLPILNVTGSTIIDESSDVTCYDYVYVQNGGELTLNVPLLVRKEMIVHNGGIVTHSDCGTEATANYTINLTVNGNLTIESGGEINTSNKGFDGGYYPNDMVGHGYGPGRGFMTFSGGGHYIGSGAGHGAKGGDVNIVGDQGGSSYGSLTSPTECGSGGGGYYYAHGPAYARGGDGGGAVFITVSNLLNISGTISAKGGRYGGSGSGGGSGGSIVITANNLTGNGEINSDGGLCYYGNNRHCGPGAGGRIAIYFNQSSFTGDYSAYSGYNQYFKSGAGTIYLKKINENASILIRDNVVPDSTTPYTELGNVNLTLSRLLIYQAYSSITGNIIINNNFTLYDSKLLMNQGDFVLEDSGNLTNSHLTLISGNLNVTNDLYCENMQINVKNLTVDNVFTIDSSDITADYIFDDIDALLLSYSNLTINDYISQININVFILTSSNISFSNEYLVKNVTNITLTDSSIILALGGRLNISDELLLVGTSYLSISSLSIPELVIPSSSYLTHPQNNQNLGLNITANNLTIESGGKIDVKHRGYSGGAIGLDGQGPGKGGGGVGIGGGAGYGGYGGRGYQTTTPGSPSAGGIAYGSLTNPAECGSGGGGSSFAGGGSGGGFLFINVSDTLNLTGDIYAMGQAGFSGSFSGGSGSGGTVYIHTGNLVGTGSITANGADGRIATFGASGGGAGGRIAIYYNQSTFRGDYAAYGGMYHNPYPAPGTIYLKNISENFGKLVVRNDKSTAGRTPLDPSFLNDTLNNLDIGPNAVIYCNPSCLFNITDELNITNAVLAVNLVTDRISFIINRFFENNVTYPPQFSLTYENGTAGQIKFIQPVVDANNLSQNIIIGNNFAFVNATDITGFNKIANITLYGIGDRGFSIPAILRDGLLCVDCFNFTSLIAQTVVFNVSGFSTYSIGELPDMIFPEINFTEPPTPPNDTSTSDENVTFNVSITEQNLKQVIKNWNWTNYSIYNDSLVLMMNFDNVSAIGDNNTYFVDVTGYGNNGTASNFDGDEIVDGKYGKAIDLDATNYLTCGIDMPGIHARNSATLEAWFKADNMRTQIIMGIGKHQDRRSFILILFSDGSIAAASNGGYYYTSDESGLYVPGQWHHFAATLSQGVTAGVPRLYLDGEPVSGSGVGPILIELQECLIGRFTGGSAFFNGTIDEPRIWNRPLSAAEIKQHYYSNLHKYDTDKWALLVNESVEPCLTQNYTYAICVSDISGNENCTETRFIKKRESCPPTLTWTWANNLTATDPQANITLGSSEVLSSCRITINGTDYDMIQNSSTSYYYGWDVPSNGNYTIRARCNDTANNFGWAPFAWYNLAIDAPIILNKIANVSSVIPSGSINWTIYVENNGTYPINVTLADSNGLNTAISDLAPGNNHTESYITIASCNDSINTVNATAINSYTSKSFSKALIVASVHCGDGICNCDETTATCAVDCPAPSGGGGCSEPWDCDPWGACINGTQSRECDCGCADEDDCYGDYAIERSCDCETALDCGDNNSCTADSCIDNSCIYSDLTGTACDDGNMCTDQDTCEDGVCTPGDFICACEGDGDCDDSDICTADSCVNDTCEYAKLTRSQCFDEECQRCFSSGGFDEPPPIISNGSCTLEWDCSDWGACIDGTQQRSCSCACSDQDCTGDSARTRACNMPGLHLIITPHDPIFGDTLNVTVVDGSGNVIDDAEISYMTDRGERMFLTGSQFTPSLPGRLYLTAKKQGYSDDEAELFIRNLPHESVGSISQIFDDITTLLLESPPRTMLLVVAILFLILLLTKRRKRKEKDLEKI